MIFAVALLNASAGVKCDDLKDIAAGMQSAALMGFAMMKETIDDATSGGLSSQGQNSFGFGPLSMSNSWSSSIGNNNGDTRRKRSPCGGKGRKGRAVNEALDAEIEASRSKRSPCVEVGSTTVAPERKRRAVNQGLEAEIETSRIKRNPCWGRRWTTTVAPERKRRAVNEERHIIPINI